MARKRPRLPTFSYNGLYRYFLTFCTHERRRVFVDNDPVALVWEQIVNAADVHAFAVLAYVFMPDHVHLLVEGQREDADLKAFASLAKQKSAFNYSQHFSRRLWQASYYDRVLRDEESTWDVIRYILDNPVRAGLCLDAAEYPFLGSGVMDRDQLFAELAMQPVNRWPPKRRGSQP